MKTVIVLALCAAIAHTQPTVKIRPFQIFSVDMFGSTVPYLSKVEPQRRNVYSEIVAHAEIVANGPQFSFVISIIFALNLKLSEYLRENSNFIWKFEFTLK